jgi:hypothetical protein
MSGLGPLPPEMEIANVEHELAVLRERYSRMVVRAERAERLLVYGYAAALVAAATGLGYAVTTGNGDASAKLFLLTALLIASGLMVWLCKDRSRDDTKPMFFGSLSRFRYPFATDEEFFHHAIAIREQRLRELKATL